VRVSFVYSRAFSRFNYGPTHPLRVERLPLTVALIEAYGLLDHPDLDWQEAEAADEADLVRFHDPAYLAALKEANQGHYHNGLAAFGLGPGDNPVFPGVWDWSLLVAGASIRAARSVAEGRAKIAFNIAGGLHHAGPARASGFCYLNDAVLAIQVLLEQGLRVAYLDIDAHHGDGVQNAFYDTDRVLTVSLHQSGRTLFPGTGFAGEQGRGLGRGYSVNLPLPPYTDSEIYLRAFDEVVPPLLRAFKPDALVSQLGVDGLHGDPLANLCLTDRVVTRVCRTLRETGLPWVGLGGGGYHLVNVARCWTLALAEMLGLELPAELPTLFLGRIRDYSPRRQLLRDEDQLVSPSARRRIEEEVRRQVEIIRESVFPVHGL